MTNHCNCKPGSDCLACDNIDTSKWEHVGAAILIAGLTVLTVLIIAGGAGWLYGTLGAL